jgi:hypothetical protein
MILLFGLPCYNRGRREQIMNERKAHQMGYNFHGAYSHNKEEMKQRALELRKQGNKALVVNEPPNPLSRGHHGMGYSVYWIESEENIRLRNQAKAERARAELIAEREKLSERIKEIDLLLSPAPEVGPDYDFLRKAAQEDRAIEELENSENAG